jgi:hypothetical protein
MIIIFIVLEQGSGNPSILEKSLFFDGVSGEVKRIRAKRVTDSLTPVLEMFYIIMFIFQYMSNISQLEECQQGNVQNG